MGNPKNKSNNKSKEKAENNGGTFQSTGETAVCSGLYRVEHHRSKFGSRGSKDHGPEQEFFLLQGVPLPLLPCLRRASHVSPGEKGELYLGRSRFCRKGLTLRQHKRSPGTLTG